jgi:DNA mismatch repair protein MutL
MNENTAQRALIQILDENTICRIAAGEVVVSGAYAIKEMIENSIDAGADEIITEYSGAGLSSITVSDNGRGMTREDILMALEHHATSKLKTVSDLSEIKTYGFRGEALPSIAAVSRCEIISSTASSLPAVSVKIEGGEIKSVQNAAAARGTKISIKNLFYNTPVRKKFLKSESYENALIIEFVTRYALAHPEIKFGLYSGGREIFSTRRDSSVEEVIASIFPEIISGNLIALDKNTALDGFGTMRVKILMSPPHISKPNTRFQYFFVNGRPFKNKSVAHAVYEAYGRYCSQKQYPVVFMFLNLEQKHIDVNIHPTKTEVAFACEFKIHDAISKIISEGLITSRAAPHDFKTFTGGEETDDARTAHDAGNSFAAPVNIQNSNFMLNRYSKTQGINCLTNTGFDSIAGANAPRPDGRDGAGNGAEECAETGLFDFGRDAGESYLYNKPGGSRLIIKKVIGQAFGAFILAEDEDGLLLIDQHVAAEKVFYEKILSALQKGDFNSQSLLMPHIYDLSVSEFEMLKQNFDLFKKYGFDVEIFSEKSIVVRSAPDFLEGVEEKNMIFEIISAGIEAGRIDETAFCDKVAANMACKASIKAGKTINIETAELIIADLIKCANPYFCPHGRPIIVKLQLRDLLSKFKRSL